jgi:hypothetical protein
MRGAIVAMLLVAGCEKNLALPDGPTADASPYCAEPVPPFASGMHLLYLATEGVVLSRGTSDSATNTSDIVKMGGAAVPAFLPGDPNRLVFRDQIVRLAQAQLAPYSLDIVTERPASGEYYLFTLGGDAPSLVDGGVAGLYSVSDFGCSPMPRNSVDMMFDNGTAIGANIYVSTLLSDLGAISGLGLTVDPGDCMCRSDPACTFAEVCTYGKMAMTVASTYNCNRTPTQDEPLLLQAVYGCR